MKIKDITGWLETVAPLPLQESYDNCGLLVGDPEAETHKALLTLDVTEEVMQEAMDNGCDMIIAHHPLIFSGLKKLNGRNIVERIAIAAIKNDIAIYAIHTNLDNIQQGVNHKIAEKLGLKNTRILAPKSGQLRKLVTYCPVQDTPSGRNVPEAVRQALWEAGAGHIGNYDACSFTVPGTGTYKALEGSDPYIGQQGVLERQEEERIEVIFPHWLQSGLIKALIKAHPYEEVAYDIFPLENASAEVGAGMLGELEEAIEAQDFLQMLKKNMQADVVRHSPLLDKKMKKVAVCGGSGSFLLRNAIAAGADVLVTADLKYHQFFEAEGKILIADIGHYESEQFTPELIYEIIRKKFSNFALLNSKVRTNPINYL